MRRLPDNWKEEAYKYFLSKFPGIEQGLKDHVNEFILVHRITKARPLYVGPKPQESMITAYRTILGVVTNPDIDFSNVNSEHYLSGKPQNYEGWLDVPKRVIITHNADGLADKVEVNCGSPIQLWARDTMTPRIGSKKYRGRVWTSNFSMHIGDEAVEEYLKQHFGDELSQFYNNILRKAAEN
jgi:hypothetical protein